jgi:hypothetical protein
MLPDSHSALARSPVARIRVYRSEADGEDFPRLCMKCGRPAECDVSQNFAWMPSWVHILLLAGWLPWLVVALVTRKTMRVVAPMCRQHAGHWRVRRLYVWLGLLFWLAYAVALVAVGGRLPESAMGPAILFGIFGGLAWLVTAAVFASKAIRASIIREKRMDLVNVHREFADAWNDAME